MTNLRFLPNAITKAKTKLINIAEKDGIYENFGQKEVANIKDKYINISSYSDEMNKARNLIHSFDSWCMNYNCPQTA